MIVTSTGRIVSLSGIGATGFTPLVWTPVVPPPLPKLDTGTGMAIGMDLATAGNISLQIEKINAGNRAAQAAVDAYNGQMNTYLLNGGPSNKYGYKEPVLPNVQAIYQAAANAAITGSFTASPRTDVALPQDISGGVVTVPHPVSQSTPPPVSGSTNAQAQSSGATVGGPTSATDTTGGTAPAGLGLSGLEIVIAIVGLGLTFLMFSKGEGKR